MGMAAAGDKGFTFNPAQTFSNYNTFTATPAFKFEFPKIEYPSFNIGDIGTPVFNFTPPTINIPKYDSAELIKQMNEMLNTTQKTLTETLKKGQEDIMKASLLSANTEAERLNTLIGKTTLTLNKLDEAGIKKTDVKVVVNSLSNLMTNLDKLTAASTGLDIEKNIRTISDAGRNAITQTATNMDKLLDKLNTSETAIKNTKVTTQNQKNEITTLLSQLASNKQILIDTGTSTMEKIAELTKNNISTLQTMNDEKLKIMEAAKSIPTQIINNIKSTNEMAYDINQIKADPAMAAYMKKYISKTEETNGILAAKKAINGITAFQAMIEYKKNNPIASTLLPKLMDVPIGWEKEQTYIITGENKNTIKFDAPIQMKGPEQQQPQLPTRTEISMSQWIKENPTTDPMIGAKLFTQKESNERSYNITLDNMKNMISSGQHDLTLSQAERDDGKGISSEVWSELDRRVLKSTGEVYTYKESGKKIDTTPLTPAGQTKTTSLTYFGLQQPGESAIDYNNRLTSQFGLTHTFTPTLIETSTGGKTVTSKKEMDAMLAAKGTGKQPSEAPGTWDQLVNAGLGWYYGGGDAGRAQLGVEKGVLTEKTYKIGELKQSPATIRTIDEFKTAVVTDITKMFNVAKGYGSNDQTLIVYEAKDKDALVNAAINGKSFGGLNVDQTRYSAYKVMTPIDVEKMVSTPQGAKNVAVDIGQLDLKDEVASKLTTTAQKKVAEQANDPYVTRRISSLPFQYFQAGTDMVLNPYMSENPYVNAAGFVIGGGFVGELSGVGKVGIKLAKVGETGLTNSIKLSAGALSTLMVPGIGKTDGLANALKNEQGIFEVIGKQTYTWKANTIDMESKVFAAATNDAETKKLLNYVIDESAKDPSGTVAKLGTSILTNPGQIEKVQLRISQIPGIPTDNVKIFNNILSEATTKVDIQASNLGKELNAMNPTQIGDNVQKLRLEIGEIPTQNLMNRALVIDNGKNAAAIFKGWEALNTKVDEAFEPLRTTVPVTQYNPGTPMNLVETLGKTIGMPPDALKAIQDLGTKYGETIEDTLKNIDLESMKIQNDLGITTKKLNTITDMMKTLMLKKGDALKEIKPIAKTLDIAYLPNVVDIKQMGEISGRLQANGIDTMADFATKTNDELAAIASKEGLSEPMLISTKYQINKKINWDATPGLESELTEKITGIPKMEVFTEDVGTPLFKRWDLDWEQAEGVKLDTETGKWSIKDTKGMTDAQFNNFVDGISQTTLRDMDINDLPSLSADNVEDATRRKMLSIAQEQAKEGSVPFEFMTTTPGEMSLAEPYKYVIDKGSELRRKADIALEESYGKEASRITPETIQPSKGLTPDQVEKQAEFVEDIQATGMLPGGTETIASDIPTMEITGKDIRESTTIQVGLPEGRWIEPTILPNSTDEALELANKTYDEIKIRTTNDLVDDTTKALDGDIDAINRVYVKDPTLGSMIDTRNTLQAHANNAIGNKEMQRAINAAKNGRDDQAALLFKRMDPKSSMEGYVKSGYFDDVTMKDLQRLEPSGVSPEMTTKLMVERSNAATAALGKESKSIAFKLENGITDFTKDELKIMTSDKQLANAIDATWNPIGKQTNIIADAMMKNANDLKEIERLEGLKNIARELVC